MFPSNVAAHAAVATQLVEALVVYEQDLDTLIQRRWDPELYAKLGEEFDQMRLYASSLPRLAFSWTELLITRVEMSNALWAARSPTRLNGRVLGLYAQHKTAMAEV